MQLALDTIMLFVLDLSNMKAFYNNVLQLPIVEEIHGQWVLLRAGSCHIGLHQIPAEYLPTAAPTNPEESVTKLIFELQEDIVTARENLLAQQVVLQDIKTFEGYNYWLCDGQDPEGNVFQLKQAKG